MKSIQYFYTAARTGAILLSFASFMGGMSCANQHADENPACQQLILLYYLKIDEDQEEGNFTADERSDMEDAIFLTCNNHPEEGYLNKYDGVSR